jgi:aminoglycoside phosphotransferase (APT) family kinase protein
VLSHERAAGWLLEHELLTAEAVLDEDLAIKDASSRNRNFRVETRQGPCYLLKQGPTPETAASVAHEAAVYRRLAHNGGAMSAYMPALRGYDPSDGVLVLELVRDAEDLRTLHLRSEGFATGPAALLGSALGALHRATQLTVAEPTAAGMPGVLWIHRPSASTFRDASGAAVELIRIVQGEPGFPEALDGLRAGWRQQALVHGDVKWDNCLVSTGDGGGEELRLVDWESAAPGDPCWDIGSALSQYLSWWLFSIPVTGDTSPERFPELASCPLEKMQPALAACWRSYADARALERGRYEAELLRAVACAGARLVQSALESAQMLQQITSDVVLHLQLALNILQRPQEAATGLMGLTPAPASRP